MAHNFEGPQALNFDCNSCNRPIAPSDPRIHCQICHNYDLCANCALGDRFDNQHSPSHQIQLFKESGSINGHQAMVSRNIIIFSQPQPYVQSPPLQPPTYTQPLQFSQPSDSQQNYEGWGSPPPLPPRTGLASENWPPQFAPEGWRPFFLSDMTPTPTFMTLLNDIFSYLDTSNSGYLIPEAYSRFLDDIGYVGQQNSWKGGYIATVTMSAESMADKSLKNAYDLFSIEHMVQQSVQPPYVDPMEVSSQSRGILGNAFSPAVLQSQTPPPGPMPLLTRKGFLDITSIEVLGNPSKEWGNLSYIIKKYNLPRYIGWGDIPRSMLPDHPDPRILRKVADIHATANAKAEQELVASYARNTLIAQGGYNAADFIGGDTMVYQRG